MDKFVTVLGDVPKVAATRKHFAELRASLKNALDVTSDIEAQIGAGEGSRPSSPVAPDGPGNSCVDPLGDAITVLENVRIEDPSARTDTEDAQNRVNLALEYLRMVCTCGRGESCSAARCKGTPKEPLRAIADALRDDPRGLNQGRVLP